MVPKESKKFKLADVKSPKKCNVVWISCEKLSFWMKKYSKTMLIIDIRLENECINLKMESDVCLNIPSDIIHHGMLPYRLGKYVDEKETRFSAKFARLRWLKRIVLMDSDSCDHSTPQNPLNILIGILNNRYFKLAEKSKTLYVLKGGYQAWSDYIVHFSHCGIKAGTDFEEISSKDLSISLEDRAIEMQGDEDTRPPELLDFVDPITIQRNLTGIEEDAERLDTASNFKIKRSIKYLPLPIRKHIENAMRICLLCEKYEELCGMKKVLKGELVFVYKIRQCPKMIKNVEEFRNCCIEICGEYHAVTKELRQVKTVMKFIRDQNDTGISDEAMTLYNDEQLAQFCEEYDMRW